MGRSSERLVSATAANSYVAIVAAGAVVTVAGIGNAVHCWWWREYSNATGGSLEMGEGSGGGHGAVGTIAQRRGLAEPRIQDEEARPD